MKLLLLILLSSVAVFAFTKLHLQSLQPTTSGRIVGGNATTIEQYPYHVALLRNGFYQCGGALVAPKLVVTAAHCVDPTQISELSQLNIRSGSTDSLHGGLRVAVSKLIYHEKYIHKTKNLDYDIAVLHLATDAVADGVPSALITMYETNEFDEGEIGTVTGWGATSEDGPGSFTTLRFVNVPLISEESCSVVYDGLSDRTLCAGYAEGGRDSCQGDSGGPLAIKGKLAGIVSFGFGCARPGTPGVYANVGTFREWIRIHGGI